MKKPKKTLPNGKPKCKAPKAMHAFARYVVKNIVNVKDGGHLLRSCFVDMTMTVPPYHGKVDPHYHSIVGQKLILVDWRAFYKHLQLSCPHCEAGKLDRDRTVFSKEGTLFPIFDLEGAPSWAIVMRHKCTKCKRSVDGNAAELLCGLPADLAALYPVEPKYCRGKQHISKSAWDVFENLMLTTANGEVCSRLLYNAVNQKYKQRLHMYLSYCKHNEQEAQKYPVKDGEYIVKFPPSGDVVRNQYEKGALSDLNAWRISDKDRHTREIQSVKIGTKIAQDHTHQACKNYLRRDRGEAMWTVASETGEIACVAMVPSTKAEDYAHAAKQLSNRPSFNPKVMYSDTWPDNSNFWNELLDLLLEGRLGLFHYIQRITSQMRTTHEKHNHAVADLLACIYHYNTSDYDKLIVALKSGTMSAEARQYTAEEIEDMKVEKKFRDNYGKYLRKVIKEPATIVQNLEVWWNKYKCKESEGAPPAEGKKDPKTNQTLFLEGAKDVLKEAKTNAKYLQDPKDVEMYREIKPNQNSTHKLSIWISQRGESTLESFHNMLAHFANTGMSKCLADVLNLCGTARFNMKIRLKIRIAESNARNSNMPSHWETVVSYFNHCELKHINALAVELGLEPPFDYVEDLPDDTHERFFSEYLDILKEIRHKFPIQQQDTRCCICDRCSNDPEQERPNPTATAVAHPMETQQQPNSATTANSSDQPQLSQPTQATPQTNMQNVAPPRDHPTPQRRQRNSTAINTATIPHQIPMPFMPLPQMGFHAPGTFPMMTFPATNPMPHMGVHPQTQFPVMPLPVTNPTTQTWCCEPFAEWNVGRKTGRPPHTQLCRNRMNR